MRKFLRSIAHAKMEAANIQHINKPRYAVIKGVTVRQPSKFAAHWREYLK